MDLLGTIRKEGSRGGRANFKWEDVAHDQHRENYLGHSLKAPVGRWQKNRDLSWYAKADAEGEEAERQQRAEEIRRVKEAEQDALSAALGYAPVERDGVKKPSISEREVRRVIAETNADDEGEEGGGRGVGFGAYEERKVVEGVVERVEGDAVVGGGPRRGGLSDGRDEEGREERKRRHHRDRDVGRHHHHHHRHHREEEEEKKDQRKRGGFSQDMRRHHGHGSRDRGGDQEQHHRRRRSRSRSAGEEHRRGYPRSRSRSRSPPDRRRGRMMDMHGRRREDERDRDRDRYARDHDGWEERHDRRRRDRSLLREYYRPRRRDVRSPDRRR